MVKPNDARTPVRTRRGPASPGRRAPHGGLLALALVCVARPAVAGPPDVTRATDAPTTHEGLQKVYEGCLRELDEGETIRAAGCLERVYSGLLVIDTIARTDLYYVLADLVGAHQAAATSEPRWLCRARDLVADYVSRERRAPVVRFRGKVRAMAKTLDRAILAARTQTGRDICLDPPALASTETDAAPAPLEAPAATPGIDPVAPDEPRSDPTAPREESPAPTPTPGPTAVKRGSVRQLELTAKTDLMDAGFATTLISVGVAGFGGALWAASIECKARHLTDSRCDPDPLPDAVRDAGLVLMSVGAAGVVVGLALRWVDQRRQRKLQKAPLPLVGARSVGLAWQMRF